MKFYRVELKTMREGHAGYVFTTTMAEAKREKRKFMDDHKGGADPISGDFDWEPSVEIKEIEIEPTKAGILYALNHYASHPQNG